MIETVFCDCGHSSTTSTVKMKCEKCGQEIFVERQSGVIWGLKARVGNWLHIQRSKFFWWRASIKNKFRLKWVPWRAIYIHGLPRKEVLAWKRAMEIMMADPKSRTERNIDGSSQKNTKPEEE